MTEGRVPRTKATQRLRGSGSSRGGHAGSGWCAATDGAWGLSTALRGAAGCSSFMRRLGFSELLEGVKYPSLPGVEREQARDWPESGWKVHITCADGAHVLAGTPQTAWQQGR